MIVAPRAGAHGVNPPVHLSTDLRTFAPEPATDWSDVVDFAQRADRAGFDRLAVSDHVAFGEDLEAYGDPATGGTRAARNRPARTERGSSR